MWCVYILKCHDKSLYTGVTNDLEERFKKHNSGKGARYTRSRLPVILVYRESCRTKSKALVREARIKTLTRKEKLALISRAARLLK
ncbi:MAG: GIY-YIG nuclease family protein [Candidatus Omnitrophica bacterium]|nr:GIY-YIG nuclease family protein [Candidatus Omnitrophota bacterium]